MNLETPPVRFCLWLVMVMMVWARPGAAQLAPTGTHYAGRSSDTGYSNASAQGAASSVPLEFPPSRGGLPIPVQLTFGAKGYGAAGVGWDVPLSYVIVDNSFVHRRPSMNPGAAPQPRSRITLSLLGRQLEMSPESSGWSARNDAQIRMSTDDVGPVITTWKVIDGGGNIYTFANRLALNRSTGIADPTKGGSIYFLKSIDGPTGARVMLLYNFTFTELDGTLASQVTSVDLASVSYNTDQSNTCFKHQILLNYQPAEAKPQSLAVFGGAVFARFHKIDTIEVTSRSDCGAAPQGLHTYHLYYAKDQDTAMPRLASVTVSGQQNTHEETVELPVVSYRYGAATTMVNGAPVLSYALTTSTPLPAGADLARSAEVADQFTAPVTGVPFGSIKSLQDFTGDGRPDVVFSSGGHMWMSAARAGFTFTPAAQVNDGALTQSVLDVRSMDTPRFNDVSSYNTHRDYVWRQAIDVNGDGRTDVIDAAEQSGHWVVYLNKPSATNPEVIEWQRRVLDVSSLRASLPPEDLAYTGVYVPLQIRITGRDHSEVACWKRNGSGIYESAERSKCGQWNGGADPSPTVDVQQTYTLYTLEDVNGDGYPDVVFNTAPIDWMADSAPTSGTDSWQLTMQAHHLEPVRAGTISVMYNVSGVFLPSDPAGSNAFASPVPLGDMGGCGLEKWKGDLLEGDQIQLEGCAVRDMNGDGIVDRINGNDVYLGTSDGFSGVRLQLPPAFDAGSRQRSAYVSTCPLDPHSPGFSSHISRTIRDLTGDGIPDLVEEGISGHYQVFMGTGAGFASTPIDVQGSFDISYANEDCHGSWSSTVSGLFDVDGDGTTDFVAADGASLDIYQLTGGDAKRMGNIDASRIIAVDNGFGATAKLTYASAKDDASTRHQVPFPEVVVTSVENSAGFGLGGSLATTRTAYGDIEMVYDSVSDGFRPTGYRRQVELVTAPVAAIKGVPPTASNVVITDRYRLDIPTTVQLYYLSGPQRLGRYLLAGMVSDVTELAGNLGADPWQLLTIDITSDPRRTGGTHYSVDTMDTRLLIGSNPVTDDPCTDVVYPYDYTLSVANSSDYTPCTTRGFLYTRAVVSWRGTAAPPSSANVQSATTTRSVDDYGRVTSTLYQNDLTVDDDVCVDLTYAGQTDGDSPLTAIASRKVWDCIKTSKVYGEESWTYDKQVPGLVFRGLPTSHTIYRHSTDDGAYLSTIRQYDVDYDALGNPISLVTAREDGATRTTSVTYDPFGLSIASTTVNGTNVHSLSAQRTIDALTGQVLLAQEPNHTVRGRTFDGFGRAVKDTISTPEHPVPQTVATHQYLGFDGSDPLGRRITVSAYVDPVDDADLGKASARVSTTFLDELGRSRYDAVQLGADYASETLLVGSRVYDSLGRIAFEADAYPKSQDAATAYGTTRYFAADGSLAAEIRGLGVQPYTTLSSASTELFPTLYSHSFANHAETTSVRDPDSLTTGSPQAGVIHQAVKTAIGRVVSRSTVQGSSRLEYEEFGYDALGDQASMQRYQDPVNALNPVHWQWRFDSLGHVLRLEEPSNDPQERAYDNWGELTSSASHPTTGPVHAVATQYDAYGRVVSSVETNDGVKDTATEDTYSYDQNAASTWLTPTYLVGRLAHVTSATRTVDYSYDTYGRTNARVYTSESGAPYIERQGIHADGSQAWLQLELPDNDHRPERMDYDYDTAGRMRWMWFSDGVNTSELFNATTLDAWGRVRSAQLGAAQYFGYFSDVGRRLPTSTKVESTAGLRAIDYTAFDAVGRETARHEKLGSFIGTQNVTYDALGRMVTSKKNHGTLITEQWQYKYDALGNVFSLDDQVGTSDVAMTFDPNDRDRICGIGYGTSPNGCNLKYDYAGSITFEPTRTGYNKLAYFNSGDVRNVVNKNGTTAAFTYDAFGELADLSVTSGSTDLRDDHNFGAFITARSRKTATASVSYVARRFPGPGLEISRRGPSDTWIFQFSDTRGTRFTVDQKGNYVQEVSYSPYGASTSTGAVPGQLNFTSEQWNEGEALEDFGLVQLGKRLYDPALGRFLSRDPLLIPRTAATSNPYSFAMNDPINLSDPSGMDPDLNGGAIYASSGGTQFNTNGGSQFSDGTPVAVGLLAGSLLRYFGVKIDSWFTSSFDQAAFNAARNMQMAMIQMMARTSVDEDDSLEGVNYWDANPAAIDPHNVMSSTWTYDKQGNLLRPMGGYEDTAYSLEVKMFAAVAAPTLFFLAMMSQASNHNETVIPIVQFGISGDGGRGEEPEPEPEPKPEPHGNSKLSTKAQHVYEVKSTDASGTSETYKYGISGGRVTKAGMSYRATSQVNALNRSAAGVTYQSEIVARIPAGPGARQAALDLERKLVYAFKDLYGAKPPGNIRP